MSSKSAYKVKMPKVAPRSMDEITGEYNQLIAKAGQIQYQIHVHESDLKQTNERLRQLNYEAAERNKLNQAAQPKEVANEQV